ncbi:uncharacterized protein POLR1D isoform X2 [Rhinatrema bivittatum]|uniref:uncharacterized protein POLR1D isoform X2 n=1 Tax=Rhinatrema bivittatum TaxID=194408 RepID=UPI001125E5A5|nr:uncharacterized protein POLR1D isoform X2 [Rhinatrema bivittatum]
MGRKRLGARSPWLLNNGICSWGLRLLPACTNERWHLGGLAGGLKERQTGESKIRWKAVEELLKEAKRGKTRAETMGPMGWKSTPMTTASLMSLITLPSSPPCTHLDSKKPLTRTDSETTLVPDIDMPEPP